MNMYSPAPRFLARTLAVALAVLALTCGFAAAQQPPDAPPPLPDGAGAPPPPDAAAVPQTPEQPATTKAQQQTPAAPTTAPVFPPPATAKAIILNFKDASLDTVLNYLSETAGLAVVRETTVEGRITVTSRQPLSVDESVTLLNSVLKEKGYAAVRMGRILKIVTVDEVRKRNVPVRTGNDPAAIEATDEVITQVVPLRFIDAVKLKADLAPLVPVTATLASNAAGNALIVTDSSANIRRVVEIVRALDTHMAGVAEVKVFQLKYANATSAAKLLNEVFKDDTSQQQQTGTTGGRFFGFGGGFGGFRGPGQTQTQTQTDDSARRAPRVTATADDRTNTLVVTGPSDTLKVVEGILKDLDSNPAEDQSVMVYPLRNAQAKTLETVLNNLFGTTQSSRTGTGTNAAQRFGQQVFGGTQVSTTTQQLASGLLGQVYVVANSDTNSLMVMTAPKNFTAVKAILADLDRSVPQVLIKVLLAEVTHDDKSDIGVEFSVLNLQPFGRKTNLSTSLGVAAQTTSGNPNGLVYSLVDGDFTGILRALETVGKLDVLSRPYILASDNQLATINVGQQIPLITNTRTTDTGNTINTIQYQKFGIILKVTPHINPEGLVIMDVNPSITTMTGQTVPISEVVSAPVFAERSAQSRIAIRDGQTIVIGGMIEDRKTDTISKVPYLGSIPVIGWLFQRTVTQKSKTELLIFLTPLVARNGAELKDISAREEGGAKLVPKAIDESAYKEHMKGLKKEEPAPATAPESAPAPQSAPEAAPTGNAPGAGKQ